MNTIDEVIAAIEGIITESIRQNKRTGYFAALYYKVTCRVKEGIINGEFKDGPRMERLDVVFASRYLDALAGWGKKEPITASWKTAFDATEKSSALLLQHLLLGINAHINLDLGIAAAIVANGHPLEDIREDYNAINMIIASLTYEVFNEIGRISPLLSLLGLHATNYTSVLVQFSIVDARDGAWCFAEELIKNGQGGFAQCVSERDKTISELAAGLIHVKGFVRLTRWVIHLFEWRRPARIISALKEYKKAHFSIAEKMNSK